MIDHLMLISGNDIPCSSIGTSIHQPILKQIGLIGEEVFWRGCEALKFDRTMLQVKQEKLQQYSDLAILLSLLSQDHIEVKKIKNNTLMVLTLLFPNYNVSLDIENFKIELSNETEKCFIDEKNFQDFKDITFQIFSLKGKDSESYNPQGSLAKQIAEKLKKGRKKAAVERKKDDNQRLTFLGKYASIVAAGKNKSINDIMQYTIYQLMDEYNRMMLLKANCQWFDLKIAGATKLGQQPDWTKQLY